MPRSIQKIVLNPSALSIIIFCKLISFMQNDLGAPKSMGKNTKLNLVKGKARSHICWGRKASKSLIPHCGYFPSANQCASDDPSVFDLISTVVRGESVEAFAIP